MNAIEILTEGEPGQRVQYIAVTQMASYILEEEGFLPRGAKHDDLIFDHARRRQRIFNERFTHYPETYSDALLVWHATNLALHVVQHEGYTEGTFPRVPSRFAELDREVWECVADYYQPEPAA